jgi:hypothetical protein
MIDEDRPTDLLYVAALGAEAVNFSGISRDRMFAAIEALELADPSESDRWGAFVPGRGVRKASDPADAEILERAESRLRVLGARYFADEAERRAFHMIVSVVRGLGIVEDEEIGRWYSEFIVAEEPVAADGGRYTGLYGVAGLKLGRFVRMIAPPKQRYRGLRVNLVEVFDHAIAIRWHHIRPEPDYNGERVWPSDETDGLVAEGGSDASLTDDVGTDYGPSLGGTSWTRWSDGSIVGHGIEVRTPAPPPGATQLTYRKYGLEITLPVTRDD